EVNTGCNLDCPICFADSGHQPDGYSITAEQCERMLDVFVASEGEAEVVMFSGGEPTIHPEILEFIDLARLRPIKSVNLNTNGIRLASDKRFVADLGARNRPAGSLNIYLQFDGLDERTHRAIRGRDLRDIKQRALDNCAEAGLTVTLVAAIERGLNEHEIGPIISHGLTHPAVRSIAFQPVTHSGRHTTFDPMTRLTNSDVLHLIADQLPQWFQVDDFFPVPCCFPTCRSITYLLTEGVPGEPDFGLVPIPRLLNVEDYLDYVSNRVLPDDGVRDALEKLWSASAFIGTDTSNERLRHIGHIGHMAEALDCADACGINLPEAVKQISDKAFMIVVQDFQDPYTLNVRQLMKCCVEEITPDGRLIPFCAYNSVGYREQVRTAMSGVPVADVVPNAVQLQPLVTQSPYGSKVAIDPGSVT
ncbi:MAG: radical SAM protein, partial [Catenulispora sp.]|nr:radical SAM protein [Catenulispora sp.]